MPKSVMKSVTRSFLFLSVLSSIVACSKSDNKASAPVATPQQQSNTAPKAEENKSSIDNKDAKEASGLPTGGAPNSKPTGQPANDNDSKKPPEFSNGPAAGTGEEKPKNPPPTQTPKNSKPTETKPKEAKPPKVSELDKLIQEASIYGNVSSDGLKNVLFQRIKELPKATAITTLQRSLRVSEVRVFIDSETKEVYVEVSSANSKQKVSTLRLGGKIDESTLQGKLINLSDESKNKSIGTISCLTSDCRNALIRVNQGVRNGFTQLEIIYRKSNVFEHFTFDSKNMSNSPNIQQFKNLVLNTRTAFTTYHSPGDFTNFSEFSSIEVVGGITDFRYFATTIENGFLSLSGRLYNANLPSHGLESLSLAVPEINLINADGVPYNTSIQYSIRSANLKSHNNKGKLQIELNFINTNDPAQDDKVILGLSSDPAPIKSVP